MQQGETQSEPDLAIATRFLTAQMWWLGSELVRRHPQLLMTMIDVDTLLGPAAADRCERRWLLVVHDERDHLHVQFDLDDGIEFQAGAEAHTLNWVQVFTARVPLDVIEVIEAALQLDSPSVTAAATAHSLVYRVIASALTTALDDPHDWCAVPAPISVDDVPGSPGGPLFEGFSSTAVPRGRYANTYLSAQPRARSTGSPRAAVFPDAAVFPEAAASRASEFSQPFWALLRDDEPIAIFDTAGILHTVLGSTELLSFYEDCGRELSLVTARLLGPYLP